MSREADEETPSAGDDTGRLGAGRSMVREAISSVSEAGRKRRIELFTAALMALATIGTAWVSYESSRWGSLQTASFNEENALRVESTKASSAAGQLAQVDAALFIEAVNAFASGDDGLFEFYVERAREEFKPALSAWLATDPASNPDAPLTPFDLPEYENALAEEARELEQAAQASTATAARANQRSDNYVLAAVVFAAILFFAGISSRFQTERVRLALLAIATVGFVINSTWVATFPVILDL